MADPVNQIFLVLDSLRWDTFNQTRPASLANLGEWKKAYAPGTYTFPSHMSFFVGRLPHTLDGSPYYDSLATHDFPAGGRGRCSEQLWRLVNLEAPKAATHAVVDENIVKGFAERGYRTIGTGAVNWFNPELPAGRYLSEMFSEYRWFGSQNHAEDQIAWCLERIRVSSEPYFLFINFGETHHRYRFKGCEWWDDKSDPYGDAQLCAARQQAALVYLASKIRDLLAECQDYDLVICADHGDAWGEAGLWGHGFFHPTVIEVPLLYVVKSSMSSPLAGLAQGQAGAVPYGLEGLKGAGRLKIGWNRFLYAIMRRLAFKHDKRSSATPAKDRRAGRGRQ